MKNVALITGASGGIGQELARIHADHGGDVIAVATNAERLAALKQELEQAYGVTIMTIVKDLSQTSAASEIFEAVKAAGIDVEILINNAGFGGWGKFHERDMSADLAMIHLNVIALTELTRLFLPDFVTRGRGRILNVSSIASLVPGPLQAVYFATKAYVTSFSNALSGELAGSSVTVTNLMPGVTATGFAAKAGLEKTGLFDNAASARPVAEDGYKAMLRGDVDVISGATFFQRLSLWLAPFLPKRIILAQVRKAQQINS